MNGVIVLIGLPGSGKTTVGRQLAADAAIAFYDADELIAAAAGVDLDSLFARDDGEATYRRLQRDVVGRLLAGPGPAVVALGSSAPLDDELARLLDPAHTVWLDVSDALAVRRAGLAVPHPALKVSPRAIWRQLAAPRRAAYERATSIRVPVDGQSPAQIAQRVARLLDSDGGRRADDAEADGAPADAASPEPAQEADDSE